jgi:hypothetical protein
VSDRIESLWAALGALTFAETLQVAETMRDAADCMTDFEVSNAHDWSILLNTAREIAEDRTEDVA